MKSRYTFSYLIKILLCFFVTLSFSSMALAKEINLYDQPKTDAKVLGKVDLTAGIIPIYTPNQSQWVKIADPRNGNVGWVKSSDLNSAGTVTFTQRIFDEGKGAHTYQLIEYGQPQKLTPQQVQGMVQKMQIQQRTLQHSFQNAVQQMMDQINSLSQGHLNFQPSNYPMILPIIIIPEQKGMPASVPTPAKTAPTTTVPAKTS